MKESCPQTLRTGQVTWIAKTTKGSNRRASSRLQFLTMSCAPRQLQRRQEGFRRLWRNWSRNCEPQWHSRIPGFHLPCLQLQWKLDTSLGRPPIGFHCKTGPRQPTRLVKATPTDRQHSMDSQRLMLTCWSGLARCNDCGCRAVPGGQRELNQSFPATQEPTSIAGSHDAAGMSELLAMGFEEEESRQMLSICEGNVGEAAVQLSEARQERLGPLRSVIG
mmetsp:Transcript_16606/g.25795  ORF Transcript_16606/g.25795 Transcript_16606/m.25795 type:complete len:220 (+) Transcript_16606:518-1177(+)